MTAILRILHVPRMITIHRTVTTHRTVTNAQKVTFSSTLQVTIPRNVTIPGALGQSSSLRWLAYLDQLESRTEKVVSNLGAVTIPRRVNNLLIF